MTAREQRIAYNKIGDVTISTIDFSLVSKHYNEQPMYETLLHGWKYDDFIYRYLTYQEATAGHKMLCALAETIKENK